MTEETKTFPATITVHWPSGPVDCCEEHARQLMVLNQFMGGGYIAQTHALDGAQCTNCVNES